MLALHLVLLFSSVATATSIWHISIDESPAPPPDQGPPFSAHAIRDRRKLPITIVGILLAYVGFCAILGTLLLTVGRHLRKHSLGPVDDMAEEITKPVRPLFQSPISPADEQRPWYSPRSLARKVSNVNSARSGSRCQSPGVHSMTSFDTRVLDADRDQRQNELERLYAAVLDHEEVVMSQEQLPEASDDEDEDEDAISEAPHPGTRLLPRLVTKSIAAGYPRDDYCSASPNSQRSPMRAIYPPNVISSSGGPRHLSPISTDWPPRNTSAASNYPPRTTSANSSYAPYSPSAASTHEMQDLTPASRQDPMRRLGHTIRRMAIDTSLRSPSADSQATPLASAAQIVPTSTPPSIPSTPGTYHSPTRRPPTPIFPLPSPARSQEDTLSALPDLRSMSSLGVLPLRGPMSPGVTRTTFLDVQNRGGAGPRTGLPTPYSPYMPFTPMTPVTPRLVGRREARALRREEAREGRQGGLVRGSGEMWD